MTFRKRRICTSFLHSSKLSLNNVVEEEDEEEVEEDEDGEADEEFDSRLCSTNNQVLLELVVELFVIHRRNPSCNLCERTNMFLDFSNALELFAKR